MTKLELDLGKEIIRPIYISPVVLKRKPDEFSGITVENEILAKRRAESRCQELERIIRNLRENEQVLIGLQTRISDLQKELGDERLTGEKTKQDLQTKIQEGDERLHIIQEQYGNEILEH